MDREWMISSIEERRGGEELCGNDKEIYIYKKR